VAYTAAELLEVADTAIHNLLTGKYASQTVGGRSYTKQTIGDLMQARRYFARLATTANRPFSISNLRAGDGR